jgi:hypothetical protein
LHIPKSVESSTMGRWILPTTAVWVCVAFVTTAPATASVAENAAPAPVAGPCDGRAVDSAPWCDRTLGHGARAVALVANLTDEEKSRMFRTDNRPTYNNSVPRLAIPSYQWWREALHGLWSHEGLKGTVWPEPIGVGVRDRLHVSDRPVTPLPTSRTRSSNCHPPRSAIHTLCLRCRSPFFLQTLCLRCRPPLLDALQGLDWGLGRTRKLSKA